MNRRPSAMWCPVKRATGAALGAGHAGNGPKSDGNQTGLIRRMPSCSIAS